MLTDTGPIVALMDESERQHKACISVVRKLPAGPLRTTWPCFSEAMYLLGGLGGHLLQNRLWQAREEGKIVLFDITVLEADRMRVLMTQYKDRPMDLADASLIAIAESRDIHRVFTLDSDFFFYVLADGSVLEVIRGEHS